MSGPVMRPSTKKATGMRIGTQVWNLVVYPNWTVSSWGTAPSEVSRKTETVSLSGTSVGRLAGGGAGIDLVDAQALGRP